MTVISEEDPHYHKILAFLLKAKGFDGHRYKPNYIKRRIAVRMRATGKTSYSDYSHVLHSDEKEVSRLLDRLTIHVTEFFRDPSVFTALESRVFPDLAKDPETKVRIWCAGCSTGEEPYSLAIGLQEWSGGKALKDFSILGTDIDPPSVRTAEKGDYPKEALAKIPKDRASRWFKAEGDRVTVSRELKKRVQFRTHDLLENWSQYLSGFHLILCRNLLIYLTGPQQQKLYERFHERLVPGGYLVLGLTETLLGPSRRFYRCVDVRHRIYQAVTAEPSGNKESHG